MEINKIIVHCSDSDIASHDNIETIRKWHVHENGWRNVGYHIFIDKNGSVFKGRKLTKMGAHTRGHNRNSIGICVSGKYEFTAIQLSSLKAEITELIEHYNLTWTDVYGHRDFDASKTCPNFNVRLL